MAAVGFPVALDRWTRQRSQRRAYGVSFTLRAALAVTTFDMGDGHQVTCTAPAMYPTSTKSALQEVPRVRLHLPELIAAEGQLHRDRHDELADRLECARPVRVDARQPQRQLVAPGRRTERPRGPVADSGVRWLAWRASRRNHPEQPPDPAPPSAPRASAVASSISCSVATRAPEPEMIPRASATCSTDSGSPAVRPAARRPPGLRRPWRWRSGRSACLPRRSSPCRLAGDASSPNTPARRRGTGRPGQAATRNVPARPEVRAGPAQRSADLQRRTTVYRRSCAPPRPVAPARAPSRAVASGIEGLAGLGGDVQVLPAGHLRPSPPAAGQPAPRCRRTTLVEQLHRPHQQQVAEQDGAGPPNASGVSPPAPAVACLPCQLDVRSRDARAGVGSVHHVVVHQGAGRAAGQGSLLPVSRRRHLDPTGRRPGNPRQQNAGRSRLPPENASPAHQLSRPPAPARQSRCRVGKEAGQLGADSCRNSAERGSGGPG